MIEYKNYYSTKKCILEIIFLIFGKVLLLLLIVIIKLFYIIKEL